MGEIDPFIRTLLLDEPSLAWFGFSIEEAHDGTAVVAGTVGADQVNAHGIAHGGLVFALADQAFAMATNTVLPYAATADASIQFLRPSRLGQHLVATARTTYRDARRAVADVEVCVDGQAVALLRGTARAMPRREV